MVSVPQPREILLSGRLSRIPEIAQILVSRLSRFGKVRNVTRRAKVAKEAAEGAYIIGTGIANDEYTDIYDCLKLSEASGTMYDYIFLKGVKVKSQ